MFKISVCKARSFVGDFAVFMTASAACLVALGVPIFLLSVAVLSVSLGESPVSVAVFYATSLWEDRFELLSFCTGVASAISLMFATAAAILIGK